MNTTPVVRLDSIRSADWQLAAGELGAVVEGVEAIGQAIRTVLTTPRGSSPLRPDFGSSLFDYLDAPIGEARPQVVREVVEAVERWERRAEIVAVHVEASADGAGLSVSVEWRPRGGGASVLLSVEVVR